MMTINERLRVHAAVLNTIERRRQETGDLELGAAIENRILSAELEELEKDLLANPVAPEGVPVLVSRKRPRSSQA